MVLSLRNLTNQLLILIYKVPLHISSCRNKTALCPGIMLSWTFADTIKQPYVQKSYQRFIGRRVLDKVIQLLEN